jgi:transposase
MNTTNVWVGIDVSKDWHDIAFVDSENKPLRGHLKIQNSQEGYQTLALALRELAGPKTVFHFGLESTGHYHFGLDYFLRRIPGLDVQVAVLNPLKTKKFMGCRGVKNQNDKVDSKKIADYMVTFKPAPTNESTPVFRALRHLVNFRDQLSKQKTELVNELHAVLQEYFPEFTKIIGNLKDSRLAWSLLEKYPLPEDLARLTLAKLAKIKDGREQVGDRAEALKKAASQTIGVPGVYAHQIQAMVRTIRSLHLQIHEMEDNLKKTLDTMDLPPCWTKIPGVGALTIAAMFARGADPRKFKNPKRYVAFLGLSPMYKTSGQTETRNHQNGIITKAGPPGVRRNFYMCVISAISTENNPVLLNFYERLREKGKPAKVAIVACMAKLARIIWGMFRSGKPFESDYEAKKKASESPKIGDECTARGVIN